MKHGKKTPAGGRSKTRYPSPPGKGKTVGTGSKNPKGTGQGSAGKR